MANKAFVTLTAARVEAGPVKDVAARCSRRRAFSTASSVCACCW